MIRRRPIALFSLSFLDCICCGFGAIILLFVLTMGSQTTTIRDLRERLQRILQAQLASLSEIVTKKEELQQQATQRAAIDAELRKQDTLKALLADLEKQIQYQQAGKQALLVDVDKLKKEIAALQKKPEMVLPNVKPAPVGVPVGSNYLAFVIDTSGSMRDPNTGRIWSTVVRKIEEVLEVYPEVQGIQVLDADGRYIAGRPRQWLSDSPETRSAIKRSIRDSDNDSQSNPVPGIFNALRDLHDPNNAEMKMGIYIFGDEFTGTADAVLNTLERLNPRSESGERRVVINAVGFPTAVRFGFSMGNTGVKYANLMREVTHQHGGAFIALQDL